MPEKSVSFRTHLQSNTTDLLSSAGIECVHTVRLVIGLISQLAAYTEEGRSLSPSVFICNSINHLVRIAGVGESVSLSEDIDTENSASKILKYAAPLCEGNWKIYIERKTDGRKCNFGVFCGSNDPASSTVDEVVLEDPDREFPVVRIAQSVTNKVEVRTSAGSAIEFRFNDEADIADLDSKGKIDRLAAAATNAIEPGDESFMGFMGRVLGSAIRDSHGTLIAIAPAGSGVPSALSDAVILDPPLDLYSRFRLHFEENKTAVSVSRLQTAADLLAGFVNSDGITILDSASKVLGYRAFIRNVEPENPAEGGARTRAFEGLVGIVGEGLDAAFFRSQDGRMEIAARKE